MKPGACFTCLAYRQGCNSGGCVNASTTPIDLLCQDCANSARSHKDPPNVLLCGLGHPKPLLQDLIPRLEAWITGFSAQAIGSPITVNFVGPPMIVKETDEELPAEPLTEPEQNEIYEGEAPNRKVEIIYDTCTGESRPVDHERDVIVKASDESVGYVMQILSFKNQPVLTFYDTGANQNLVQARLARDANFLQLSAKPAKIGVAGGGEITTNHGQYVAVLGPCLDGRSYSIECQAVTQITEAFPKVSLQPIIDEAREVLPTETSLPTETGGGEVKLLVGIKQTELAPRLISTLPSGVSKAGHKLIVKR